jgi:uncharacterized protein YvpB
VLVLSGRRVGAAVLGLALAAVTGAPAAAAPAKGGGGPVSLPRPQSASTAATPGSAPRATAATPPPATHPTPVVVRGTDSAVYLLGGATYADLGGQVIAPPAAVAIAVSGQPDDIIVVGTGTDHHPWIRDLAGSWQPWSSAWCASGVSLALAGSEAAPVLAAACMGSDRALWATSVGFKPGNLPAAGAWTSAGGALVTAPALLSVGGQLDDVAVGDDGHAWDGPPARPWTRLALVCMGHPEAAAAAGLTVIACRGLDNALWYITGAPGNWSAPQAGGGGLADMLQARALAGGVAIDIAGPDQHVAEKSLSSQGQSAWSTLPGVAALTPEFPYLLDNVPVYLQSMPLDCETAALQMGMAALGHYYSQDALFSLEAPDLRGAYWSNGVLHWGDPYTNFVGSVYGSEGNYTGYGVYYPVIAGIARGHGLPNTWGGEALSPLTIYNALAEHHPVQVWVEYHWARPTVGQWIAFDGRAVSYTTWEHSVTLSGVTDAAVRVNDPTRSASYWVSRAQFEASWHDFDNMAVVFQ